MFDPKRPAPHRLVRDETDSHRRVSIPVNGRSGSRAGATPNKIDNGGFDLAIGRSRVAGWLTVRIEKKLNKTDDLNRRISAGCAVEDGHRDQRIAHHHVITGYAPNRVVSATHELKRSGRGTASAASELRSPP